MSLGQNPTASDDWTPDPERLTQELRASVDEIEAPCDPHDFRALRRIVQNRKNYVAVSFGGGGLPGVAGNCALQRIFEELGIRQHVEEVWGVSAGSIVGSTYALGVETDEVIRHVMSIDPRRAIDIPLWSVWVRGFAKFLRSRELPEGFVRGQRFRSAINAGIRDRTFEECDVPLNIIACTDDGHAQKIVLNSGQVMHAISASMCIPGVMLPVLKPGSTTEGYLDGGIVEKTPLVSIMERHARLRRDRTLVVLTSHFDSTGYRARPRGFLERLLSTMSHLEDEAWEFQLKRVKETGICKPIILNAHLPFRGVFNFDHFRLNYLAARRRFKQQLSNSELGLRFSAR